MRREALPALIAVTIASGCAGLSFLPWVGPAGPAHVPPAEYWVYVGAESADLMQRIRYGPGGAVVERTTPVGELVIDVEGPHGLAVAPDGRHLFLTTGHGIPDGHLWKFETGVDTLVGGPVLLGRFPSTVAVSPDGLFAFIANLNLHGDRVPSTISVVYTPGMLEVAQIETCVMPHGSRFSRSGFHHYSVCMMDDQLVEIDTRTLTVSRRFSLVPGMEVPIWPGREPPAAAHGHGSASCSPTWVEPAPGGGRLWVACNGSNQLLEIDVEQWYAPRRLLTGTGPYNIAISPDGRLLAVTLRPQGAVQFFELWSYESLAVVGTSGRLPHGVVITPDGRYAFVSVEGVGGEPGKVDVFELETFGLVASVEVGMQAAGLAFWRMEAVPEEG